MTIDKTAIDISNVKELLYELFDYFEIDSGDWPMISVYNNGEFYHGIVDDRLYSLLVELRDTVNLIED